MVTSRSGMRRSYTFFLFALLILLASCGAGNRVMDTGLLQKRKHLPGWDLSLRSLRPLQNAGRPIKTDTAERPHRKAGTEVLAPEEGQDVEPEELFASITDHELPLALERSPSPSGVTPTRIGSLEIEGSIVRAPEILQDPEPEERPKKRWNKFAIPAFLAALGTIYLGLFSISTIAVIGGLVITFTLSGISLRQIRVRDEAGKGFAIIALMLALLATMATAMVTYVVGFI